MKKLVFGLMFASVLTACGSATTDSATSQDSVKVATDTAVVDLQESVEQDSVTAK